LIFPDFKTTWIRKPFCHLLILKKQFEDCDECESFLCDECTIDICGETLWVCEECDFEFGLCGSCYVDGNHGHEHDFIEIPNIFDLGKYSIFSFKKNYLARGNRTISLIGSHPLTISALVGKEETDDADVWSITFRNQLFQNDLIKGYVIGAEKLIEIVKGFPPTVTILGEGLVMNLQT